VPHPGLGEQGGLQLLEEGGDALPVGGDQEAECRGFTVLGEVFDGGVEGGAAGAGCVADLVGALGTDGLAPVVEAALIASAIED
jgi:hypothetical protein